jgi:hypothetical protein
MQSKAKENVMMSNFRMCMPVSKVISEDERGGACSTHGKPMVRWEHIRIRIDLTA